MKVNEYVARRVFDVMTNAELAHLMTGISHEGYLANKRHLYSGQARRLIDRMIESGPKCGDLVRVFILEMEK